MLLGQVSAWMNGADTQYAVGVYGTQGVAAGANVPGARYSAVSWIDSRNNLWLFGEISYDPALVEYPFLYDVWKFDAATKTWTWMQPHGLRVCDTRTPVSANVPPLSVICHWS